VRKLKISSSSGSGKGAITESMAEDAITLPTLKKRVAELEEEVAAKKEIEAETMELQEQQYPDEYYSVREDMPVHSRDWT